MANTETTMDFVAHLENLEGGVRIKCGACGTPYRKPSGVLEKERCTCCGLIMVRPRDAKW